MHLPSLMKSFAVSTLVMTFALSAHADDVHKEVRALSRAKAKVERKVAKEFRALKLDSDAEYQRLRDAALAEATAFSKMRREYPTLKAHYDQSDAIQSKAVKAKVAGDNAEFSRLMTEYSKARMALEIEADKIPELTAAKKSSQEAHEKAEARRLFLMKKTPEGRALAAEIEALDVKINALRKKLKK